MQTICLDFLAVAVLDVDASVGRNLCGIVNDFMRSIAVVKDSTVNSILDMLSLLGIVLGEGIDLYDALLSNCPVLYFEFSEQIMFLSLPFGL